MRTGSTLAFGTVDVLETEAGKTSAVGTEDVSSAVDEVEEVEADVDVVVVDAALAQEKQCRLYRTAA